MTIYHKTKSGTFRADCGTVHQVDILGESLSRYRVRFIGPETVKSMLYQTIRPRKPGSVDMVPKASVRLEP